MTEDESDLAVLDVIIRLADAATQPGLGLLSDQSSEPSFGQTLSEVVVVGVSCGSIEATEAGHQVVGERVVVLDPFDRVVQLGAALIGRREPQGTVLPEEPLSQLNSTFQ